MRMILAILALFGVMASASAQHSHGGDYAAMKSREIKALSSDQITQLREGRGMGLSLPAELNSYPGPMHVLDMRDTLSLTAAQQAKIEAVYQAMSMEAKAIGAQIVAAEGRLDRMFATSSAKNEAVTALLDEIAQLSGRLRAVHILAHMETRASLDRHQIALYDRARGYAASAGHRH
jgi:hypothetical protein